MGDFVYQIRQIYHDYLLALEQYAGSKYDPAERLALETAIEGAVAALELLWSESDLDLDDL